MQGRGAGAVRTAVVWDVIAEAIGGRGELDVIDVGGGTGNFAVPLARRGHRVTVVDSSADALAALERRTAEAGVAVRGVQGDAIDVPDLVGDGAADLILCHSVLEFVDDPHEAIIAISRVARPAALVSIVAANQIAAVLHRAMAGQFDQARHALADPDGRWGEADPVPRRFTADSLAALLAKASLSVRSVHGVRVVADLVPGALVDGDSGTAAALVELEKAAAGHPLLRDLATQLHVLAER